MTVTESPSFALSTPCIRICTLDAASGLCIGCGRSVAEIGGWLRFGEAERLAIMALLPERLARIEGRDREV